MHKFFAKDRDAYPTRKNLRSAVPFAMNEKTFN